MITDEDDQRLADEEQKQLEALCAELEAEFHPDTALEREICAACRLGALVFTSRVAFRISNYRSLSRGGPSS
jgi:hypothetical protein